MAAIKSYTDIEQSKKLSEILPLESADMYYLAKPDNTNSNMVASDICIPRRSENDGQAFGEACAWSLTALFKLLPKSARLEKGNVTELYRVILPVELETSDWYIDPVDACVVMIERLYELNFL